MWWILLFILALLLALFGLPAGAKIDYNDGSLRVHLLVFFLKFLLYDSDKPQKEKKSKKKKPQKQSTPKTENKPKKKFDFKTLPSLFRASARAMSVFFKNLRVTKVNLTVAVGGEDPYKTGMTFGMLNAAAYPILGFLNTVEHIKLKHVSIYPDFLSERTRIKASFKAKISPIYLIKMLWIVGVEFLKTTSKNNKTQEKEGYNYGKSVDSGNSGNLDGQTAGTR